MRYRRRRSFRRRGRGRSRRVKALKIGYRM